jgi:ubiquinone/menaquinone biosynthesis C-methylase UbiE
LKGLRRKKELFDTWPDRYDAWFETPIGALVKEIEAVLILDLLNPGPREVILDAGCGTGVFTIDLLRRGARVLGVDLSLPMLFSAREKTGALAFDMAAADILDLPFRDGAFDKVMSITTLEFIPEGEKAARELWRVTKSGGTLVVATLNSLSPWAKRRKGQAQRRKTIFEHAIFRSPEEVESLLSLPGDVTTAIHFEKDAGLEEAVEIEKRGRLASLKTGAFVAARWYKP